jgi:hypothetical protein
LVTRIRTAAGDDPQPLQRIAFHLPAAQVALIG